MNKLITDSDESNTNSSNGYQTNLSQVETFLCTDFDSLISIDGFNLSNRSTNSTNTKSSTSQDAENNNDTNLTDVSPGIRAVEHQTITHSLRYIRGFLLIRLLFHICLTYTKTLQKDGWTAIIKFLLWTQSQNALPRELVEIDDFSDARGGNLTPSIFSKKCREKAINERTKRCQKNVSTQPMRESSLWESMTSLGGLLWTPGTAEKSNHSTTSNNSIENSGQKKSHGNDTLEIPVNPFSRLLTLCLSKCKVDQLLFHSTRDVNDTQLGDILTCLLSTALHAQQSSSCNSEVEIGKYAVKVTKFLSLYRNSNVSSSANEVDVNTGNKTSADNHEIISDPIIEIDAVIALEWVSSIIFVNMRRASAMWPIVHGTYTYIYEC